MSSRREGEGVYHLGWSYCQSSSFECSQAAHDAMMHTAQVLTFLLPAAVGFDFAVDTSCNSEDA